MMRKISIVLLIVVIASAMIISTTGCGRPPQAADVTTAGPGPEAPAAGPATTTRQVGSTTVLPLAEKWRDEFNKQHPEVSLAVSGGGSGAGIEAVINGSAEIGNSSRDIKSKEKEQAAAAGVNIVEHTVAYDGIAVIVHPDNPLNEISEEKLSEIYTGKAANWDAIGAKGLGDTQVINRDSASGTYEAFKEMVVQLHGKAKEADYAAGTLNQSSNQAVLSLVSQTKTGIGYVGLGYINDSVKVLKIIPAGGGAAVAPSVQTVQDKTYPISRPLYMYTRGEPTGTLLEYMNYVKSAAGQAIVEQLGFVPVSEAGAAPAA